MGIGRVNNKLLYTYCSFDGTLIEYATANKSVHCCFSFPVSDDESFHMMVF